MKAVVVTGLIVGISLGVTTERLGHESPSLRSCGTLAVGIGWHVESTSTVSCPAGRRVMRTYLAHRSSVVADYACRKRDLSDGEHVRCTRAERVVTAVSLGY